MKISIITTCYNRAGTISDAMRSVFAQDYRDIEYIIVDGEIHSSAKEYPTYAQIEVQISNWLMSAPHE